jgi:hypothetical protein
MKVSYKRLVGPEYMTGALMATSGKNMKTIEFPSVETFKKMALSCGGVPHSPIRTILYRVYIEDIKSWVVTHLVRHYVGVQFYVKSQRTDRNITNPTERDHKEQGELIGVMFDINANALLDLAKARSCTKAAPETREVVSLLKQKLLDGDAYDFIIGQLMVPPCEWYEKCFEPTPCKKTQTSSKQLSLNLGGK